YGIPGHYVEDGNDLMAVYEKMHEVINYVRSGNGPAIVEVESYRWFGHSTADAGVYRTKEEVDSWKAKDPVKRYRAYLIENEIATEEELAAIEAQVIKEVEEGVKFAEESPFPDMSVAFEDVFVD
ncbi:TPA: thiamine pyrophosphate-dependent enzyme, partial [Streptococcus agalactiae]